MAYKMCDEAITGVFGVEWATVTVFKNDGVINNMRKFRETKVGHATYAYKGLKWAIDNKIIVDRIIIFSDEQCYNESSSGGWLIQQYGQYGIRRTTEQYASLAEQFELYKRKVNPKVKMYSIDLAGYGTSQFPENDRSVILLAGFSDKLLEFINKYEATGQSIVDYIRKTEPREPYRPRHWFPKQENKNDKAGNDIDAR